MLLGKIGQVASTPRDPTLQGNKELLREGTAAMYGMMATIPDKTIISEFVVNFFSELYKKSLLDYNSSTFT